MPDYIDQPMSFRVHVPEDVDPVGAPPGTPPVAKGDYDVVMRRHWPGKGVDAKTGALHSGADWYGIERSGGNVWIPAEKTESLTG